MDSLFDDVSRILAQPWPRRTTLRIVVGTVAGVAIGALLPGQAALACTVPCGTDPITGKPVLCPSGQVCCNPNSNACCAAESCVPNGGFSICCAVGKACGNCCCKPTEVCCGCGSNRACCETTTNRCDALGVCTPLPVDMPQCASCRSWEWCELGKCTCANSLCAATAPKGQVHICRKDGTCGPPI